MYRQYSLLLVFPLLFTLGILFLILEDRDAIKGQNDDTVNAVLGDESYLQTYGEYPDEDVPETVRIKTHLQYVETLLRKRPTDHLSDQQKQNRAKNLDYLREYFIAGEFPQNDGYPGSRRPTFISNNGNICAVGYLVEQSLGREAVKAINEKFKYAYISEIDSPAFQKWIESSGFTLRELAMIQPEYGPVVVEEVEQYENRVDFSYGIGSSLLTSANILYLSNSSKNPWLFDDSTSNHWFGLAAGSGSILLGVLNLDNSQSYLEPLYPEISGCGISCPYREVTVQNNTRTVLSVANIGVGLFSLLRSGYHLIKNTSQHSTKTSFGVTQLEPGPVLSSRSIPAAQFRVRF